MHPFFFQRHVVMTIIIAKMREKSVEQTVLANKTTMKDEHERVGITGFRRRLQLRQTQPARQGTKFHRTEI